MKSYTTEELLEITGVRRNVLVTWLNARRIVPEIAAEVGRGRRSLYSHRNLFEVALASELHIFGVSGAQIQELLDFFRCLDAPDVPEGSIEVAESWTRLRSREAPANAILLYRPDSPNPFFRFLIGGNGIPTRLLTGGPAHIVIDVASMLTRLRVKTDQWWPAELRRKPNRKVWARIKTLEDARIKTRDDAGIKALEEHRRREGYRSPEYFEKRLIEEVRGPQRRET